MSGMSITVKVDDAAVKAALSALAQRAVNMRPVMRDIGNTLKSDALRNFKEQHAPDGTAWTPLKASTIAKRRKGKGAGSAQILQDTGLLKASVNLQDVTNASVTVGSRMPYAAIHQFGGTIQFGARSFKVRLRKNKDGKSVFAKDSHKRAVVKWGTNSTGWSVRIPARPFIGMSTQAESDILAMLGRHLAGGTQ